MREIHDQDSLDRAIVSAGNKIVVVMFMDKRCPHCKRVMPEMEKLALQHVLVIFLKIDVGNFPEFAYKYGISGVPECFLYKDQVWKDRVPGANPQIVEKLMQELSG